MEIRYEICVWNGAVTKVLMGLLIEWEFALNFGEIYKGLTSAQLLIK